MNSLPRQIAPAIEMEESVVAIGEAPSPGRAIELGPGDSIGEALREARLEAGLTAYEVAKYTHIQAGRVLEIEGDNFTGCGPAVLARGRLVAIARAVGVDPAPLLAAFDAQQATESAPRVVPDTPLERPASVNWTVVLLCALGVVALYPIALLFAHVLG